MTDIIDRYGLLDPALGQRETNAALATALDKWSLLDQTRGASIINAKVSGTIDQYGVLDPARWRQQVNGAGGSSPYVAKAVHFDGDTYVGLTDQGAALASDSPTGTAVVWLKGSDIFNGVDHEATLVASLTNGSFDITNARGVINAIGGDYGNADFSGNFEWGTPPTVIPDDVWTCVLCSWDMNHEIGDRIQQLYFGDSAQTPGIEVEGGGAFAINYSDTAWVFFCNNSGPSAGSMTCDAADFSLRCGTFVDFSVEANRRLFIDANGKPVNPSVATASLGSASALFSGDATGFAINQGIGGATSVLAGTLTNASTSPSD